MVRNCGRMETTFYDEQSFPAIVNGNELKRPLTLDLNPARGMLKRQKSNNQIPLLSSPDLKILKIGGTPEFDRILYSNNGIPATPSQILFPRTVTEEQEIYARGFVDALNELHNSDSSQGGLQVMDQPVTTSASLSGGITYTNLEPHPAFSLNGGYGLDSVVIKDEPQTVPSMGSTPPLSPIDMECQEKIKLERKRQRNRVAASKCRRRKLERISRLEDKVKLLKGENTELSGVVNKLKQQVCHLKQQVMDHMQAGCQIGQTY